MTTEEMKQSIDVYFHTVWKQEPSDLESLEALKLPPMGNMPCMLYCCFNLFWLGESFQHLRASALAGTADLDTLCFAAASECVRHASRLSKWDVPETLKLVGQLGEYFTSRTPKDSLEFVEIVTAALVTLNVMQNWIDTVIPWSKMDAALGGPNAVYPG